MPPSIAEPHWAQILSWLSTPFVAIIAAVFAGMIAYRQWKTAQDKLKLDLFDRRFAVYDTARNLLASIMNMNQLKEGELIKFLSGTRESKWLLNDEITNFFEKELWVKANKLQTLFIVLDSLPRGQERNENIEKQSELIKWFREQYSVLDQKFEPFLKLKH